MPLINSTVTNQTASSELDRSDMHFSVVFFPRHLKLIACHPDYLLTELMKPIRYHHQYPDTRQDSS